MFNDPLPLRGKLQIFRNGVLEREVDNLVVTTGRNFVASRLGGAGANVMSHMALGTGTTAAALGDTTLQTENARVALSAATVSANTIEYTATFPAGTGTGAVTEAGILNAASAGTLLCRTVFSAINKGASDSVTIVWTVTVA